MADANIGHNEAPEEKRKRLLFQYANLIAPFRGAVKEANAEISRIKASAKKQGITARMLKRFFEMREKDERDIKIEVESDLEIARWLALPFVNQPDLFEAPDPDVDAAYLEGEAAGLLGETLHVPDKYAPDSESGQLYVQGWHSGQAKNAIPLFDNSESEEEDGEEFTDDEGEEPDI